MKYIQMKQFVITFYTADAVVKVITTSVKTRKMLIPVTNLSAKYLLLYLVFFSFTAEW